MKNYKFKQITVFLFFFVLVIGVFAQPNYDYTKLKREKLNRGLVVVKKDSNTNFLSWRYFSSDPMDISFNIYRNGSKINDKPIIKGTFFEDKTASSSEQTYILKSLVQGLEKEEQKYTLPSNAPIGYVNIPLNKPKDGVTPDGQAYSYSPNDASIGDVDGDGEYEIILKWDPSNAHDNSHKGYTGNVFIDCYKLNGTKLWRIDLGKNIRAGAHYTQFMVFDLDGDNKAEIIMKTADGSVDGLGNIIGDAKLDFRNSDGFILSGSEYLTIFNGETGAAMQTLPYDPPRGDLMGWGDDKGNRMDRYLAAIAYLDGEHPSVVMCRGYYSRTVLVAYDWRNGKLTKRWIFDSNTPGNESYAGQGNHNLRIGDVDGDGCDEIIYGSCAIDHDGTGLYNTKLGHGDAIHLTVFDPKRKGLQVWDCHENRRDGSTYRDAGTGEILFQVPSSIDVGRCMAADIDPNHAGVEMWSWESKGIRNIKGEVIDTAMQNMSVNMACWWDGDLLRELLDKNQITKYDYKNGGGVETLLTAEGCVSNNGTKATPAIQGDIVGDWREEVLLRTEDNNHLRLYVSTYPTEYRFHTFLEDPIYRISMATQNVAYNQPTQPGFYMGADFGKIFPDKEIVTDTSELLLDAGMDYDSYSWSIGGDMRSRLVTSKDIPSGKRTLVNLTVVFRGYEFSDSVYVTLGSKTPLKP